MPKKSLVEMFVIIRIHLSFWSVCFSFDRNTFYLLIRSVENSSHDVLV